MTTNKDSHEYLFRVPMDLWTLLKQEAEREDRPINAHLVRILKQRYQRPPKSRQKKAAS
jgi:hypothetical protein